MADRGDTHYHVPTLNLWFLGSSAFFLLTMVWTVIDDWDAEWKNYQRDFRQLELEMARVEEAQLEQAGVMQTEEELLAAVAAAQEKLDANAETLEAAEQKAYELSEKRFVANEAFKGAKSVQGWEAWVKEKKLLAEKKAAKSGQEAEKFDSVWLEQELAEYRAEVYDLEFEFQRVTKEWEAAEAEVAALRKEVSDAEAALAAGTRELTRVRDKIESIDPSALDVQAANVIRDFPGLDFIGPNLKVQKFVMDHITFNLNFTVKPRIDMCTTCHMGIDKAAMSPEVLAEFGIENPGQPHLAHPRLDLFLTSKSPHPIKDVGCTVCHRGSGESLSFQHADHRPSNKDEMEEWKDEYHWHKQKYWDYPMLKDKHVEAGCVQCHKTSMELIADDAPEVFKGYELFETKGCYACHKVDWFPTKRKPGPDLTNLASKLDPGFVYSWIARPRDFRPKTHMPQVFHLENFDPDEPVVVSNWGKGREIQGQEWNDAAVAAVTSFLYDRHPERSLPPIPADMEGDAERGREVMTVTSCFACHNTAPYDENVDTPPLLSNHVTGHGRGVGKNQMGPDLRGVATKVSKEWLYNWLLNPADYWPETRMPDPRLDAQEALDVATYIMEDPDGVFRDVPDGWAVDAGWRDKLVPEVLKEQARWFFQKEGRQALEDKIADGGEWSDVNVLAAKVGEAYVTNQGCFSCHTITGMETMMPIGAELSSWSSKTVDKLDFGQHYLEEVSLPAGFARDNGIADADRKMPKLDYHYREGWLERKLAHPRIYDIDKVKTPKDKLRMPWFDLQQDEIDAIATFVLGQVEDEVGQSAMFPTAEQESIETGKRAVRQNNCLSCHMVEPPTVTFLDEMDRVVTLPAELQIFSADEPLPPRQTSLADLMEDVAEYETAWEEEVSEFTVRLMDVVPEYGIPSEKVFIPRDRLVAVTPGKGGDFIRFINEYYLYGNPFFRNEDFDPEDPVETGPEWFPSTISFDEDLGANVIEDVDGELRAYGDKTVDEVRWTFAPPSLFEEGHKLQAPWFYGFLKDPVTLRRQLRVKMPRFHYEAGEAEAIADYFAAKARWEWHARYAKTLRVALGRTIKAGLADGSEAHEWDLERESRTWPTLSFITDHAVMTVEEMAEAMKADPTRTWGLTPDTIRAIENGSKPETLASFDKLKAFGDAMGFHMTGPVKTGHEYVVRRTPSYLEELGHLIDFGGSLAFNEGVDGAGRDAEGNALTQAVNCYQCHDNPNDDGQHVGLLPEAFAPSLTHATARLREEWVREWLWNPGLKYPGTKMPANFSTPVHAYDDFYPGSTNESQIEAVLAWLYNLDRPRSK